jgi:hypothetical protein
VEKGCPPPALPFSDEYPPKDGHIFRERHPQPVDKFGRKNPACGWAGQPFFVVSTSWMPLGMTAIYGGIKIEQLSGFSTIRAGYPQILGSYPQFGRLVV